MPTTLKNLNRVLRGLRQFGLLLPEDATTTDDDYILMILQFLNEAKEEIEDSGWAWQALRQTVTLTLRADVAEYSLLAADDADVDTNDRTRILYETLTTAGPTPGFYNTSSSLPMVFDTTDSASVRLTEVSQERMEGLYLRDPAFQGLPTSFATWAGSGSIRLKVWPTPDKARTIVLRLYIPQAELTPASLTATSLAIPSRPVWTLALFKANQERGEELGQDGSSLHAAYLDAHGAAEGKEQTASDQTVYLER